MVHMLSPLYTRSTSLNSRIPESQPRDLARRRNQWIVFSAQLTERLQIHGIFWTKAQRNPIMFFLHPPYCKVDNHPYHRKTMGVLTLPHIKAIFWKNTQFEKYVHVKLEISFPLPAIFCRLKHDKEILKKPTWHGTLTLPRNRGNHWCSLYNHPGSL